VSELDVAVETGDVVAPPSVQTPVGGRPARRRREVAVVLSMIWIGLVLFAAVTASWLPLKDELDSDVLHKLSRPGENGFLLGSDGLGRDIFARIIHGSRVSVIISVFAVLIGIVGGGLLGMLVGMIRGRFERSVMFVNDIALAFPALVLLLGLLAYVGQSLMVITVTIGLLSIPRYTRVARANTLSIAEREFVIAARALGAKGHRVLLREIAPNVVIPLAAFGLLSIGVVIVLEGSLSFLGLSVPQPTPSWGSMIAEGKRHLNDAPHVSLIPSIVMFLTVLAVNFVGDNARARFFDVRESGLS
jgi:peptide/nickel transport system permease protein